MAAWQITISLPTVIPSVNLPPNVEEAIGSAQVLNMNLFTILPVGCWSSGFNFYHTLLATTLPILIVCATLFALGQIRREVRTHEAALLPTHLCLTYFGHYLPSLSCTQLALGVAARWCFFHHSSDSNPVPHSTHNLNYYIQGVSLRRL